MHDLIQSLTSGIRLGARQHAGMMDLFPVYSDLPEHSPYLTLAEAMEMDVINIREAGIGIVSSVIAENRGELPVLILDGEILKGAMQDRAVNVSLFIPPKTSLTIPVTCTERGRWSFDFNSPNFRDSGVCMSPKMHAVKVNAVTESLKNYGGFASNQTEVWNYIDDYFDKANVTSQTRAMKDLYTAHQRSLDEYLRSFTRFKGQRGFVVFIGGKLAGFVYLSNAKAFRSQYDRLLRSFALDAALEEPRHYRMPSKKSVRDFFEAVGRCEFSEFPSCGTGTQLRIEGVNIAGSGLIHDGIPLYLGIFSREKRTATQTDDFRTRFYYHPDLYQRNVANREGRERTVNKRVQRTD